MKVDKTTGRIEFGSISVSPETMPEDVKSQYYGSILQTGSVASEEKIVLQNNEYWIRLNFKTGKLAQIDFTQLRDGKPTDDDDDVWELKMYLEHQYGKQSGAPFWKLQHFSGGGPGEPPIGGWSFRINHRGFFWKAFGRYERQNRQSSLCSLPAKCLLTGVFGFLIAFLLGYYIHDGKIDWRISSIFALVGLLLPCVSRLAERFERLAPHKILSGIDVNAEREKRIRMLGWRWTIQNGALCRIDLASGEVQRRIELDDLKEIWMINTDEGPMLEDLWWNCLLADGTELSIGSEIVSDDVEEWFLSLSGIDLEAFTRCMRCTDNRRTLLWRQSPFACIWSDAWVMTSLLLIGKNPITLAHLIGAADFLNHAIPRTDEVNHALSILCSNEFLRIDDNANILVADKADAIKDAAFQKAKMFDKIEIVRQYLIQHATVPCLAVQEYFTDGDMTQAYKKYTRFPEEKHKTCPSPAGGTEAGK